MAGNDDASQFELVSRRKSARLHNTEEDEDLNAGPSLTHKAILKKIKARGSAKIFRPPPVQQPPEISQPNNTVSKTIETPPLVHDEEPVAQTLPCKPSEASQALKSPPLKTPASPGDVTMPILEPVQKVHNPVRRHCRGSKSSPLLPTHRSSRLKKSSTELEGTGTAETANPTPDNQSGPTETPNSTTASKISLQQSDSDWSDWVRRKAANQQGSTGDSESLVDSEMHPAVKDDDGGKRGIIRRKLRDCEEALLLNLRELDEENTEGAEGKRKRKRGQKSDVRWGRSIAKHRKPAAPECRPELMVVGDAEFTSHPLCTKVVTTIRILTLENLPRPYQTYNMFPTKARLEILKKFLQRYSWAEGEDVKRCLEVYEKIASEAYGREFTVLRKKYDKKYGEDKEVWKDFPPQWCKNPVYWKGLCLIWSKEKWSKVSSTNRDNKNGQDREEKVIHHVAGSRSTFRHNQALVSEKGSAVSLKEVFDRTHMKVSGETKVYVNEKAKRVAKTFEDLKEIHGEVMSDEDLWELAADGEDTRGRLYGFGQKSRTCKISKALAAEDASMSEPTKSTATSAEDERGTFTKSHVAMLVASKIAAERRMFAKDIAEQEERHTKAFEEYKKQTEHNKACIEALYRQIGATIPTPNEAASSKSNDGGGANGVVEDDVDANLEFFQDEMPDHPLEVSIDQQFDWDGMTPQIDEFELVEDTMSQGEEEEDNPIEGGDEDLNTDQSEEEEDNTIIVSDNEFGMDHLGEDEFGF